MIEKRSFNFQNCPVLIFTINSTLKAAIIDLTTILDLIGKSNFQHINHDATQFLLEKIYPFKESPIVYHEVSGLPKLKNFPFSISKSHSHNFLAVCLEQKDRTGCDIELIRPKVIRVREKFLNKHELNYIDENNIKKNILAWSIKESLLKVNSQRSFNYLDNIIVKQIIETNSKEFMSEALLLEDKPKICSLKSWEIENFIFTVVEKISEF